MTSCRDRNPFRAILFVCLFTLCGGLAAQSQRSAKAELGSQTAKNGFKNETEIQNKFNNWKTDADAWDWLVAMNYKPQAIESVIATKPHGEKADVEVRIKTKKGETVEGISIKLVSGANGFNQIDKRWLAHYVTMWKIPADVETALRYFVGETPPSKAGRDPQRMYLNELTAGQQKAVIDFFTAKRIMVVHDLFRGDGPHAAGWIMVALKTTETTHWTLRRVEVVMRFYGDGAVEMTSRGNLKIGRITVQRKGGDGGRDTAKMLQFKVNPAQLFDSK
ncbi:MAG: type II restriction endonuclease [Acidobacteriota bacterium]